MSKGVSAVEERIANGPGHTGDPEASRYTFTIRDNDDCRNPAATPGGVVYKIDDSGRSCICATESRHPSVRRQLNRTNPTPGDDGIWGNDDDGTETLAPAAPSVIKQLAAQFHDPGYLYCADSPYKGLQ